MMTDFSFQPDGGDDAQKIDTDSLPSIADESASTRNDSAPAATAPSPPLPVIAAAKVGEAQVPIPTAPSPALPTLPTAQKTTAATTPAAPSPPLPQIPASAAAKSAPAAAKEDPVVKEEWSLDDAPAAPQKAAAPTATTPPANAPLLPGATAPGARQSASTRSNQPNATNPAAPRAAAPASTRAAHSGAAPSPTTGARAPVTPAKSAPAPTLPTMSPAAQAHKKDGMPASGEIARNQMNTSSREHIDARPMWRQYFDKLDPIAMWLSMASLVVGGLCIAYLLYAIFGLGIGTAVGNDAQMADTIAKVAVGLRFALIVLSLSLVVLMFDVTALGPSMALLGFALYFGSLLMLKPLGDSLATRALVQQLIPAGKVLLVVGLLKYSLNLGAWLATLPQRMKSHASVGIADLAEPAQQRAAKHANMFSPCWQLPFCREVIRKQCPAYLARTRCWKFGRGCYCDEEMISRIIRGENTDQVTAPTRMSRQGKPPCGRCYIFLEHQSMKYKSLAWLAIPATGAIAFFGWPLYERLFALGNIALGNLWTRLAFSKATDAGTQVIDNIAGSGDLSQYQMSPAQVQAAAQGIFGVVIGFFILIYISKFIEWAIYKAKW